MLSTLKLDEKIGIPSLEENLNELVTNGYVLLKDVIPAKLISEIKYCIQEKLLRLGSQASIPFAEQYKQVSKIMHPYKINESIMRSIIGEDFPKRILLAPEILNLLINTIGVDIVYETFSEMPVNVKDETNDSLIKKFHQEFWSGCGYRTYSFWAPIFLAEGAGTMDMVKKSHSWGHIPHQNREPKWLPEDAEIENVKCKEGDALIFSSLTLHRTVRNTVECPRLAYVTTLRNPFENFTGFDMLHNWELLHMGAATKIMKKSGNPHLSPFRTLGSTRKSIESQKY
jgi:ectoine hydroxylase-related dioxygenase (phytanoyl-CoA dioxygenase family)